MYSIEIKEFDNSYSIVFFSLTSFILAVMLVFLLSTLMLVEKLNVIEFMLALKRLTLYFKLSKPFLLIKWHVFKLTNLFKIGFTLTIFLIFFIIFFKPFQFSYNFIQISNDLFFNLHK
jgi:hypothetical protein